jgi:GT2 family glycosyltransferase
MKVSVVIPSWNDRLELRDALRSLEEARADARAPAFETVVVDNGSRDGVSAMVRSDFPWVRLVTNADNRGFAGAVNQGIALGSGDYLLLLNPDVRVNARALQVMAGVLDGRPEAAQAAVRMVYGDGRLQSSCRRLPTLWDDFCEMLFLSARFPRSPVFNAWRMNGWAHDETRAVDQPMAACLMIRRAALRQVGPMDESFWPAYYEDVDLAARLKRAGWISVFSAEAQVVHRGSTTWRRSPLGAVRLWTRGKFLYFRKHHGPMAVRCLALHLFLRTVVVGLGMGALKRLAGRTRRPGTLQQELAAMREGCRAFLRGERIAPT